VALGTGRWIDIAGCGRYGRSVSRVNDVGGQSGFGEIITDDGEVAFHADWEARVYALNAALLRRGVYNLDQFRDALERMPPAEYLAASYYERWLAAIETLTGNALRHE
jgi:nitrile hydratase